MPCRLYFPMIPRFYDSTSRFVNMNTVIKSASADIIVKIYETCSKFIRYYAAYLAAKDVIQAGGQYHTRCWFINDNFNEMSCWVDGVGCENGLIYPNHETNYYLPYWHFVSCAMPDGTVITAKDLQGKAVEYDGGIMEFEVPSRHLNDNHLYDLGGRVIEHPIPGHIYIKNGKKYIKQ